MKKKVNNVKFLPITELEKRDLKNRIFNSIDKYISRKRRVSYAFIGLAASLVIIIGVYFSFYNYNKSNESITEFVNSLDAVSNNTSNKVTLILGDGENVKIDEEVTSINYSNSGREVTIGSTKKMSQQTSKDHQALFNTLFVPYGKRAKIKLSDGSTVWLNSGSRLVYPIAFNGKRREIYIEGEAIFDVAHDKSKPFIVISQNQEVEALGTVFSVTNYPDENSINTVLKSGSVQISYNNSKSISNTEKIKITPGSIASYNKINERIISEKVNVDNYFSWREGVLILNNNDLQFIMKRLSRYYNVKVEISEKILNNKDETFSGYLDLNEDLDKVIKCIQESTNINYKLIKDKIIIN